jgi:GT2 family glycosyltransferase
MQVSIIMVNYNTLELLRQCLLSIFEKTKDIDFEIIVVDNDSHDGSQQMLKNEFPNVILIESPNNLGFGKANNLGAKHAKGKYLFFLNTDTALINNAVKILADFLDYNPKAGICGGNLYSENRQPTLSYTMFLPSIIWELHLILNIEKLLYGKNLMFNYTNRPIKVGGIVGADMMMRSDIFNQLKGFDTDFFMYCEESELTFRCKKLGYESYNQPQAQIIHLEGKSFSNDVYRSKLYFEGRKLYYQKTHGSFYFRIANLALFAALRFRMFVHSFVKRESRQQYTNRFNMAKSAYC